MAEAYPFLKWAGGKRQILDEIENRLPSYIRTSKRIGLYIEPFVGGGAVLFYLLSNYSVETSVINDINPELMLTYSVVKKYPEQLISLLKKIQAEYLSLDETQRENHYYIKFRKTFNTLNVRTTSDKIRKAAMTIALNRTCFNGLFRQNKDGEFNVPFGQHKNPRILDELNIRSASSLLQESIILCGDYTKIEKYTDSPAFIYFDPPYRPLNASSSFTHYSKHDFNDDDQVKLSKFFQKLSSEGHSLMLSNSDPTNTDPDDVFFKKIYGGFNIKQIYARRNINANGKGRGNITELLITNY